MFDNNIDLLRAHIFEYAHMREPINVCGVHAGAGASAGTGAAEKPCALKVCLRGS